VFQQVDVVAHYQIVVLAVSNLGTMTWNVGNVRITRVVESVMPFPVDFFAEAAPHDVAAEAWLVPDFVDADGIPIQYAHPDWTARGDVDPERARATRHQLLADAATANALVLGRHFAGTSAGGILSTDGTYRFVPEPLSC